MKRIITIIALVAASAAAFAQSPLGTSYKELKTIYSSGDYVKSDTDPYSTTWAGIESFFVPGAGQLIMKENGRGWAFLGSSIVISSIGSSVADDILDLMEKDDDGKYVIPDENKSKVKGKIAVLCGVALAELGLSIWSCVDAVKIAKVKNQYYQDAKGKQAISATVYPSIDLARTGSGTTPVAGMTFAMTF